MIRSFTSFAGQLHILIFPCWVHFHLPLWFNSCCRACKKQSAPCYHQCTDDTQLSISFLPDPDTAAANLKQYLAETGFLRKASWLLLNLDKAEMMLISRRKCSEDLVKFVTAPSTENTCLVSIIRGGQCKRWVRIQPSPTLTKESSLTFCQAPSLF